MSGKRVLNILTGDYVINSPAGRLNRPWNGEMSKTNTDPENDYGAPVNDPLAPGALRKNGERMPNFEGTFLFRNDFPVMNEPGKEEQLKTDPDNDLFVTESCKGVSHVLIYSPDYNKHFAQMDEKELQAVYDAWRQFFVENKKDFEYIQIFENKGPEVGSSLPHPHCQIWSTQFLPTVIEKMFRNQENYFKKHKTSMLVDYLKKELEKKDRIVKELDHFVVLVPYWAYWPYEVIILPKRSFHSIDQMSEDESKDFMRAIQVLCRKYVKIFETSQIPYVMGLRNAPTGSYINHDFTHWTFHAIFYPPLLSNGRKKFMAGYELLSEVQRDFDTSIAAQRLRDVGE